jgi:hypothetical protein
MRNSTEQAPPFPHLKTETDPVSETLYFSYLEFRTMDRVYKPHYSECYTSLSELFRFYNLFLCRLNAHTIYDHVRSDSALYNL